MVLLIEGVNHTGKSTLAKKLAKDLGWGILKFNVPPLESPYIHFSQRIHAAIREHGNVIIDRCHFSNFAYNGRLGGGVLNEIERYALDKIIDVVFLLVDSPFVIAERLNEDVDRDDGAERLTRQDLGDIQKRFYEALGSSLIENKYSFQFPQLITEDGVTAQYVRIVNQLRNWKWSSTISMN